MDGLGRSQIGAAVKRVEAHCLALPACRDQAAFAPASMKITSPVIIFDSSLARNTTSGASSSG